MASEEEQKQVKDWEDIPNIPSEVLRGIFGYGFEKPSPIQKRGIIPMVEKKDLIAQAQSGTGKTGCFTVGILSTLDFSDGKCKGLILAPTRELADQIYNVICQIGQYIKDFKAQLFVGGSSTELDIRSIKEKTPNIAIGCPGRINDLLKRGHLKGEEMEMLVIDEADEMLSYGFKDQIYNTFQMLNPKCQVCLFSATLPADLLNMTDKFMDEPVKVLVKAEQLTLEGIKQHYVTVGNDADKFLILKDLYTALTTSQCIVYCNSISRVMHLHEALKTEGITVSCIHSGMDKKEREESYRAFRQAETRLLISSNVTARGIDIQQVSRVVNFDMPKDVHTYLHRIGRSGRWGRKGVGINFVTNRDTRKLKEIEEFYATTITELPQSFVE